MTELRKDTRIPRFHDMCVRDRIRLSGLGDMAIDLATGGLLPVQADSIIEDVVGVIAYPLAIAPNFVVDGTPVFVPMATEEPSVVAAASRGAKVALEQGGFTSEVSRPVTTVQILVKNPLKEAEELILQQRDVLLKMVSGRHKTIESLGGGAFDLETRALEDDLMVVLVHVDTRDALGANVVNDIGEALAPEIARITGGDVLSAIVTNAFEQRTVTVTARFPVSSLARGGFGEREAAQRFMDLVRWAQTDPLRAVTHNKGIMNGVIAVAMATAQDLRALSAGAHFMASRTGRYSPLSSWTLEDEHLVGRLTIPHAFATVGGMVDRQQLVVNLLERLGINTAQRLASLAAAAGLACNFSALSVLATEGIQKGHMKLHNRGK